MKKKYNNIFKIDIWATIFLNIIVNIIFINSIYSLASAESRTHNSLEKPLVDPLIPSTNVQRDLSPLERRRIEQEITKINQKASRELSLGNQDLAFQLWFRELGLQRALGRESEVIALGKIGNIAWQKNRTLELREIAQRLIAIEEKAIFSNNLNDKFLNDLGFAYQQIKYIDYAVNIYKIFLKLARKQNLWVEEKNSLEQLGKLYLAKFDYINASFIYEELLILVENDLHNQKDTQLLELYLINLGEIYYHLKQPETLIKNQKKLINIYIKEDRINLVTRLKISVGNNYQKLQQLKLASQYYQEAYTLAKSLQQVALAADALSHLAILYQQEKKWELAITIYQQLIDLERKNNNFYGLINSYENLGNIYLETNEYSPALEAFKAGLAIANSLNYKIEHLMNKIQQLE